MTGRELYDKGLEEHYEWWEDLLREDVADDADKLFDLFMAEYDKDGSLSQKTKDDLFEEIHAGLT